MEQTEHKLKEAENDYFHKFPLIDNELKLIYIGKDNVSEPDNHLFAYRFIMSNIESQEEMGGINIKAGYTENIINYRGNIGFAVNNNFRGPRYSSRSCILLIPIIKYLGLNPIWITCNIDNYASRKNIEFIKAKYLETVTIPDDSLYATYYPEKARQKLRFRWDID